jgi:hypothetical protein
MVQEHAEAVETRAAEAEAALQRLQEQAAQRNATADEAAAGAARRLDDLQRQVWLA